MRRRIFGWFLYGFLFALACIVIIPFHIWWTWHDLQMLDRKRILCNIADIG